jgi:DNA-binding response OmpR family regulator
MGAAPLLLPSLCPSPFAGAPALAMAMSSSGSAAAVRGGPQGLTGYASVGRLRALVVDPDERTRSILESRLAAEGYDVVVAQSSAEALRQLAPERPMPAIIVAEADLPGVDGFALCEQLRADDRTAQIPFVLLASRQDATHRDLAHLASADVLLPKPVFANDVVTVVRLWSGRPSSSRMIETSTSDVALPQALRALLSSNRAGRIYFRPGRGQLSFRDGRVVDATFEGAEGPEAIARMLLLASGNYTVSFGPALARATCSLSLEELCGRVFPRLGRWQRLLAHSVPLEALLAVDFQQLAQELGQLPEAINQLLRLFDGRRSVRTVVTECPWGEVTTLEAVNRLYALGLLSPSTLPPEEDDAVVLRPGAHLRLFEPRVVNAEDTMNELFGGALPPAPETFADLAPELTRQLDAFRIVPVVEEPVVAPVAADPDACEAQAFARGTAVSDAVPMADAYDALESSFFEPASPPAQSRPRPPLATAPALSLPRSEWLLIATAVCGLVVGAGLFSLARLALPGHAAPRPAVTAPPRAPRPPAPAVAPEDVPTLADGMKLYDEGKMAEAAAVLAQVVDAHPDSAPAWLMLGLARFDSGDTVGAQDAAVRATELDPKAGRAHLLMASIHIVNQDKEKADAELKAYLVLEPDGESAVEARQLLAQP